MTRLYRLDAGPHPPCLNNHSFRHRLNLYGALGTTVAHTLLLQPRCEWTTSFESESISVLETENRFFSQNNTKNA